MRLICVLAATVLCALLWLASSAQADLSLQRVGSFDSPVGLTQPSSSQPQFVLEQGGRILARSSSGEWEVFLDISQKITAGGEQGLLGLAFARDYARSGRFYVNYTNSRGDTRVVAYKRASRLRANPRSARVILAINQPYSNHNGGQLIVDRRGRLLVFTGDGGGGGDPENRAQSGKSLLGKVLRIIPKPAKKGRRYTVPRDNPFVGRPGRGEILATGLRNPWRNDLSAGRVAIADVGQGEREEVNFLSYKRLAGANFGWSRWEGSESYNPQVSAPRSKRPSFEYSHAAGRCSITGGVFVGRGSGLGALAGRYLYGDFCDGRIHSLNPRAGDRAQIAASDRDEGAVVPQLTSFGSDARGRVYAISGGGAIYQLVAEQGPARLQVREREFSLTLSRTQIPTGDVILEVVNSGEDDHDLKGELTQPAEQPAAPGTVSAFAIAAQRSGEIHTERLNLAPGEWVLWCEISGHRAAGMEANLSVGG